MTRSEALLKLIAIEPDTRDRLICATGWPMDETAAVLDELIASHRVIARDGTMGITGLVRYYPAHPVKFG